MGDFDLSIDLCISPLRKSNGLVTRLPHSDQHVKEIKVAKKSTVLTSGCLGNSLDS